jgi:hypothetical protein
MFKRFSVLLAATAVLAAAVPAMASASSLTAPAGSLVGVPNTITATGSDVIITSNLLGAITCEVLNVKASLSKNNGSTWIAAGVSELPGQNNCKNGANPDKVEITAMQVTELTSTTAGTGTMSFTTSLDIDKPSGSISCTYTGTKVPFTYTSGEMGANKGVITFTNAAGITGAPTSCGTAKLDGKFTLEVGATVLILD